MSLSIPPLAPSAPVQSAGAGSAPFGPQADARALRDAAWGGEEGLLRELLARGVSAREAPEHCKGQTALMAAASCGHLRCVLALLPHSDPLARDDRGETALMKSVITENPACLVALLPHSDPLQKSFTGRTALMQAAAVGARACCEILLPVSDLGARDRRGLTATQIAERMGNAEVAGLLNAALDAFLLNASTPAAAGPEPSARPRL